MTSRELAELEEMAKTTGLSRPDAIRAVSEIRKLKQERAELFVALVDLRRAINDALKGKGVV